MSDQPQTPTRVRCEVAGCLADATKMLRFSSVGFKKVRRFQPREYAHPLCDEHADPAFHLRPLDSPDWRLEAITSGS